MIKLSERIVDFLQRQAFTIISTIDENGLPHTSCKGIVEVDPRGKIYLLDLYHGKTSKNLANNSSVSLTVVNEHKFSGYCLKGNARIADQKDISPEIIAAWEKRISKRITQRVLKNISGEKGHTQHPESLLPQPKYMLVMEVGEVVDLTPVHLK